VARAVEVAGYSMQHRPGHRIALEFVSKALALVSQDSPEAGPLLCRYILVLGLEEGDYPGASRPFDAAMAIARRTGDVALEMLALANSSHVGYWHLEWQDTVDKGLSVIEMAQRTDSQQAEVSARQWTVIALLGMGRVNEAELLALEMLSSAEKLRDHYQLATTVWFREMIAMSQGDWEAARAYSERDLSASPSDARLLGTRLVTEFETGNTQAGHEFLEQAIAAHSLVERGARYDHASAALMTPIAARITGDMQHLHLAQAAAENIFAAESATPLVTRFARLGRGLIAVLKKDEAAAKEQYAALDGTPSGFLKLSSDRILGLLAQTLGDVDQAMVHFEDSLSFCRNSNYRPELAHSCHDYAGALVERNSTGDRNKASELLTKALLIADELGMGPLAEQDSELKARALSGPAKSSAFPGGLTHREVEVIRLTTSGRTDREIGEELFISVKTVGNHVSNILNKTGSANRTEAASFATRHGLDQ
jgi:DNA-binding CsgD family transcriptional regulator/tetratricopeptide (TPR) repeat protein